ncbi:MAG: tRNA 2-thiouridine(34) synthase MnmA [Armatimonadetes bacterium CG06_land_8_20_14_3_00_66_21]|nr:MAG: tRNA 2-thiouridine(34) synthase MnmA [Armatimonadetes bacterium CG06_land_8_20_14_3_00_66_21]
MSTSAKELVAVAMSGGVDSAVTAALLQERGFEVIGVTMELWRDAEMGEPSRSGNRCCSLAQTGDARLVAGRLGLRHYVVDLRDEFESLVVNDFCREYAAGRTPNPCLLCNKHLKFRLLLQRMQTWGVERLATGHYARLDQCPQTGRWRLRRGVDPGKDQSYALYAMGQEELARVFFPLGELTKGAVRAKAAELGLHVADKRDSQEICFTPRGGHAAFVTSRLPEAGRPGDFLNESGEVVGRHRGLAHYTIGQRRGLALSGPDRLYVTEIDAAANAVRVSGRAALARPALSAEGLNWVSGSPPAIPLRIQAQVRYNSSPQKAALVALSSESAVVQFDQPAYGIAPGQAVVFYLGDEVLGGGTIARSFERWPPDCPLSQSGDPS